MKRKPYPRTTHPLGFDLAYGILSGSTLFLVAALATEPISGLIMLGLTAGALGLAWIAATGR